MRLSGFRITNYKTIRDTDWVSITPDVTCLIGKNEAGKSAILQAIWKTGNVAGVGFDMLYDYPKEGYTRARKTDPVVTQLRYALDDSEKKQFQAKFRIDSPTVIETEHRYSGAANFKHGLAPKQLDIVATKTVLDKISEKVIAAQGEGNEELATTLNPLLAEARKALQSLTEGEKLRQAFKKLADQVGAKLPTLYSEDSTAKSGLQAAQSFQSIDEFNKLVVAWIKERLPNYIYFDDYGTLETRIHLPDYLAKSQQKPPPAMIRTQMALFKWAALDANELNNLGADKRSDETLEAAQRRKEERSTLLESSSYHLTGDWTEWWDQREHELSVEADGQDLLLKVLDNENPWKVDFQERSRGFQWFFSFYLTFLVESKEAHQNSILLLDEPGMYLHIRAQQKLIKLFRRVAKDNQLIYTSHSPFMVDPSGLDAVRTVFLKRDDASKKLYTHVSHSTEPEGDFDTLLPLQAALGYDLAQTLFLGKRTLIVEGITDYWALTFLTQYLQSKGKSSLPEQTVIIFAGGTSYMLPMVSLFIRPADVEKRILVLLDADRAGLEKAKRLRETHNLQSHELALFEEADLLNVPEAELEDLISRAELDAVLSATHGKQPSATHPHKLNVAYLKDVYKTMGWGELSHAEKARLFIALLDRWRAGVGPDPETLRQADQLFKGLTARLLRQQND